MSRNWDAVMLLVLNSYTARGPNPDVPKLAARECSQQANPTEIALIPASPPLAPEHAQQ